MAARRAMTTVGDGVGAFGALLQRHRHAAGLSQLELAERAGLSQRGIADLERGVRRSPYPATVRRLVEALGLDEAERSALLAAAQPSESASSEPAAQTPTRSLPLPLSSFVGRERQVTEVKRLLEAARLVTLTGTGGIGKTRLALEVARASADAVFVDLVPLVDGALVPAAVAAALGVREQPKVPIQELLSSHLASRDVLLVLDNCEHLVQAAAELAEALLAACPRLRILATSRERLGVPVERHWPVPSLAVPGPDAPIERRHESEAVRLFVERASAISPAFSLTPETGPSVAAVCQRLDGIPLAIELAAARVNVLSVEQIAERLDDAVRLLVAGSRTAPARQQTLRATLEWSQALLSEPERLLLSRLSVFAGGWTLEAAEAICGDDVTGPSLSAPRLERGRILDLLGQLVDKSLVLVAPEADGTPRYRLLEPLRQFAAEGLGQQAAATLRERHAHCFAELVAAAAGQYHGPGEGAALNRLEREHANIQAALDWLLERDGQPDAAGLARALVWFWILRDHWSEARIRAERMLAGLPPDADLSSHADVLLVAGNIAFNQGDFASARQWGDASLAAARQLGEPGRLAYALLLAGGLSTSRGEYAAARALFEEGLPLARGAGTRWAEARHLGSLALLALEQGNCREAVELLRSSLELARAMGDAWSQAAVLNTLGDVARSQAEYAQARHLYEQSLALVEGLSTDRRASVLHNLAYVAVHERDHDRAAALFGESLRLYQRAGDQRGVAECLAGLACLAAAFGQHERAARLFGAAEAACQALRVQLSPSNRVDCARGLAAASAGTSRAAFAAARDAGQALSLDEAVREALSLGAPPVSPSLTSGSG
jgi:predicted ATPase/DNA-binding XRE family transcriptional regulator